MVKCHKSVSWQIVFYDIQISGLLVKIVGTILFGHFVRPHIFSFFGLIIITAAAAVVLLCNHFRRQRPRTSKLGKENCSSGSEFYRTITKRIKRTSAAAKKFDPISQGLCARLFSQNCTLLLKIPSIDTNVALWFQNVSNYLI